MYFLALVSTRSTGDATIPTPSSVDPAGDLLTEAQVAAMLDLPVGKLRRLRYERTGPVSIKVAGQVRIRKADLASWLRTREV